jgi:hypothetical protein
LLAVGFAGVHLAPFAHSTTASAVQHGLIAEECPAAFTHC